MLLIGGATYGGYVLYQKYKTPKEEDVDELATGQTSLDMREFVWREWGDDRNLVV